jgi:pimeloyl-ACP methyl ester carboxylesterase
MVDSVKLTVNGINTNYIDTCREFAADNEKPVLLILHGWGCEGKTYHKLIDTLSARFRVIAPDLPGFGGTSEPPDSWGVGEYAAFIKELCEKLNIDDITLFGHSLGGRIIIKLLAEGFERASGKVILTGAAGIKPKKSTAQKLRTVVFKLGKIFLKPFPKLTLKLQNRSGSADYRAASPMMRKCLVKIVNEDLTPLLPNVHNETLLIWGENDDSTPLSDGQLMEAKMPDAGLAIIKNAGHYAFLDQPELFERILKTFLGDRN